MALPASYTPQVLRLLAEAGWPRPGRAARAATG
jgi:hypothetical protein